MSWLLSTEKQTNKNETKRTAVPELFHTGNVPDGIFFIPDIAVLCGFVSTVSAPSTHTQQETGTQTPAFPSFLSYTTDTALFSPVSFQRRTSCALPPVPPDSCSFCVGRRPPYSTEEKRRRIPVPSKSESWTEIFLFKLKYPHRARPFHRPLSA